LKDNLSIEGISKTCLSLVTTSDQLPTITDAPSELTQ
jgi:hypothetical protein